VRAVKILERILATIPIMLGVAIIVFLFMRLSPGDPVDIMMGGGGVISEGEVERLRREFNLDKPLPVQLGLFLQGAIRGDLGNSYLQRKPVTEIILERLPATIELALGALIFALVIAFPIGIISAVKQNSIIDQTSMAGAFLGISMPAFWLGIVLIIIFSVQLKWLPVQGRIGFGVGLEEVTGFYVLDSILTGNREALVSSLEAFDPALRKPWSSRSRHRCPGSALQHAGSLAPGLHHPGAGERPMGALGCDQACLAQRIDPHHNRCWIANWRFIGRQYDRGNCIQLARIRKSGGDCNF
jgi:hypothetical protein